MINADEDALVCDLAETYHIYDYRSLPLRLVATFSAGLREDSRIMMKLADMPASREVILLAGIADRVDAFRYGFSDTKEEPPSIVNQLFGVGEKRRKDSVKSFATPQEFEAELERLRGN